MRQVAEADMNRLAAALATLLLAWWQRRQHEEAARVGTPKAAPEDTGDDRGADVPGPTARAPPAERHARRACESDAAARKARVNGRTEATT